MKILLTGSQGQLGKALIALKPSGVELISFNRQDLDLANFQACRDVVHTHCPDWILNCGAYTAVDKAESEIDFANAVNAGAPRAFAEALLENGKGRLLQISTDFVFSGKQGHPYGPDAVTQPLGVYGSSKAQAEATVLDLLGNERACVMRTSWLYGPVGKNFCLTMLRLHRDRPEFGVVADQVGCPTHTAGLAAACWKVIEKVVGGIQQWSDAGAASWYDFAVAIGEEAFALGLLEKPARVNPITTAEYPTPAKRPAYSLMDCSASLKLLGFDPVHWRECLRLVLKKIA